MLKKSWFLFLILLVEGSSLMAVELMGAKFLAPFYGTSLYVWTAILGITVLGLTLGYSIGGQIAKSRSSEKLLILILSIAAILVFAMPVTASAIISFTSAIRLITGICVASFLLLVPPMLLFGLIGPLVVRLMADKMDTLGNVAGTVYFTSTLGGIFATFLFGFYWIPEAGLKFSSMITGIALALLPVIFVVKTILSGKNSMILSLTEQKVEPQKVRISSNTGKTTTDTRHIKNTVYLFAVLEGATVMAVELISARMLAPYFGSSLYVWGGVIGITLLSLALGYYAGGRLADKHPQINTIHWVLLIAAVFLTLMHYSAQHFTNAFSRIEMRTAVVLVSLLLVLPPLLFLGMVPTLLIRYVTAEIENAGITTGRVFTISSASGILALPVMGFFIIPHFGLTVPSMVIGFLVGIFPLIKLLSQEYYLSLGFIVVFLFSYSQRTKTYSSPDAEVVYYSEGLLGQVLVADVFKDAAGNRINDRILLVNRIGQTVIDKPTNTTKYNYIKFAFSVASKLPENSTALLLGLGGGCMANMLAGLKFRVDIVELDERIAEVAKRFFSLTPTAKVIVDDARHYVETTRQTYDFIFIDVFNGETQPAHVLSLECLEKAKRMLNKNGLIIINFNGYLNGVIGRSGRSVNATLQAAGLETNLLPTPGTEERRNILFVATTGPQDFRDLRSPLLYKGKPVNADSLFLKPGSLNLTDAIVFTDDKPNLDRLNIKAANAWRKSYNRTYTRFFLANGIPLFN